MKHLIIYLIIFISILIMLFIKKASKTRQNYRQLKKLSVLVFSALILTSCQAQVKYVKIPLSTPPEIFIIKSVTNRQDLMKRYQESIIKIGEWQLWYNIQAGTNYYLYKK